MTWPAEKVQRVHSLRSRGLSFSKIARAMGISRQAVQGRLARDAARAAPKLAEPSPALIRLAQFDPLARKLLEAA